MSKMRAKMKVSSVIPNSGDSQTLNFHAVSKSEAYGEEGLDENNTFSKFTPSANLSMLVNNPALMDKFIVGEEYYVDFTKAD